MQKVCAKVVLRLLNDDQKEHLMQMCQGIIEHFQTEQVLHWRVITNDEILIFEYDPEKKKKSKSSQRKFPTSLNPTILLTVQVKRQMLITVFVHSEFLLQGQMINQQVDKEVLPRMLRSVR